VVNGCCKRCQSAGCINKASGSTNLVHGRMHASQVAKEERKVETTTCASEGGHVTCTA
jgi:hypothetical protein